MILYDNGKVTIAEGKPTAKTECPACGRRFHLVTDQQGVLRFPKHRWNRRQGCSGSNRAVQPEGGA